MEVIAAIDSWLSQALTPWQTPWLDRVMSWISISGTASAVWLAIATVAIARSPSRGGAWRVYLTVLLCYISVDLVLKPAIARPRPVSIRAYEPPRALPPMPRTASFPSGHAAAAFGSALAVSRVWPQARVFWWGLAILVGYSRVYLGHHYPLDVAGGAMLGVLIAMWTLGGRHPSTYAPAAVVLRRSR